MPKSRHQVNNSNSSNSSSTSSNQNDPTILINSSSSTTTTFNRYASSPWMSSTNSGLDLAPHSPSPRRPMMPSPTESHSSLPSYSSGSGGSDEDRDSHHHHTSTSQPLTTLTTSSVLGLTSTSNSRLSSRAPSPLPLSSDPPRSSLTLNRPRPSPRTPSHLHPHTPTSSTTPSPATRPLVLNPLTPTSSSANLSRLLRDGNEREEFEALVARGVETENTPRAGVPGGRAVRGGVNLINGRRYDEDEEDGGLENTLLGNRTADGKNFDYGVANSVVENESDEFLPYGYGNGTAGHKKKSSWWGGIGVGGKGKRYRLDEKGLMSWWIGSTDFGGLGKRKNALPFSVGDLTSSLSGSASDSMEGEYEDEEGYFLDEEEMDASSGSGSGSGSGGASMSSPISTPSAFPGRRKVGLRVGKGRRGGSRSWGARFKRFWEWRLDRELGLVDGSVGGLGEKDGGSSSTGSGKGEKGRGDKERKKRNRKSSNLPPPYPYSYTRSAHPTSLTTTAIRKPQSTLSKVLKRIFSHPLFPVRTPTIILFLLILSSFIYSIVSFLVNVVFNVDREPLPWRTYCQDQAPFDHEFADSLDPVNVFVGVFSVDAAIERRQLIRSTYARYSLGDINPLGDLFLNGTEITDEGLERVREARRGKHDASLQGNIQVKFVLGKPRPTYARRVALEMEMYNDIVILDQKENMNKGKTWGFFNWASENATVPVYFEDEDGEVGVGWRKADYVVKADEDSFLVLSELERRLRVTPRRGTYWGYLIRNRFMGGECYALSQDLVQYVATYPPIKSMTVGKEDQKVAQWMMNHPNASDIAWVSERCWVYDHPKAETTYSHGFLFPDEVERVREEGMRGITEEVRGERGGIWAQAWSSVTKWKTKYLTPKPHMTMEEQVEALVEGGSRFRDWTLPNLTESQSIPYSDLVFEPDDPRLKSSKLFKDPYVENEIEEMRNGPPDPSSYDKDMEKDRIGTAGRFLVGGGASGKNVKFGHDLFRDPEEVYNEMVSAEEGKEKRAVIPETISSSSDSTSWLDDYTTSSSLGNDESLTSEDGGSTSEDGYTSFWSSSSSSSSSSESQSSSSSSSSSLNGEFSSISQPELGALPPNKQHHADLPVPIPEKPQEAKGRLIAPLSLKYDPEYLSVRSKRFLGKMNGGTVVVHYLKKSEWFLETAIALLGKGAMWDQGINNFGYSGLLGEGFDFEDERFLNVLDVDGNLKKVNIKTGGYKGKGPLEEIEVGAGLWGTGRMGGSPLIREDGYISTGREIVPDPIVETPPSNDEGTSAGGFLGRLKGKPKGALADVPVDQAEMLAEAMKEWNQGSESESVKPENESSTFGSLKEEPTEVSSLLSSSESSTSDETASTSSPAIETTSTPSASTSTSESTSTSTTSAVSESSSVSESEGISSSPLPTTSNSTTAPKTVETTSASPEASEKA